MLLIAMDFAENLQYSYNIEVNNRIETVIKAYCHVETPDFNFFH